MKLKNILIVVKDVEKSKAFYRDLFGLQPIFNGDGNVVLTEGLVLQDEALWRACIGADDIGARHSFELYFEEDDIDGFILKLEEYYPDVQYVNPLETLPWGQKMVRFYDLDQNIIEVRTANV